MKDMDKFNKIMWFIIIFSLIAATLISAFGIFLYKEWYLYLISFLMFGLLTVNAEWGRRIAKE
jgi:hypothetical protein